MRHFSHLADHARRRLFHTEPGAFGADSPREVLAGALGATLYVPGDREDLPGTVRRATARGVRSMVVCLEDSVADHAVVAAAAAAVSALRALARGGGDLPLLFVRVRSVSQIRQLVEELGEDVGVLSGFVVPKFTAERGERYLAALGGLAADAQRRAGHRLRVMPVLESAEVIHAETRAGALAEVAALLAEHREDVLAVRTGATDLSGVYGLRRGRDLTVWDVRVVADVLADVVNVLGRADGTGFTITGPVWEYFAGGERLFKPRLRVTPFEEHDAADLRRRLVRGDLDGLLREVSLDKANGLTGKTVIHPSHVSAVHALHVVTHEEFCDATDVLGVTAGGVLRSEYRNKMNEARPHQAWARRVLERAAVFGVAHPDVSFVDLLAA